MANEKTSNFNQKLAQLCSNMSELEKMTSKFTDYYSRLMDKPDGKDNAITKLDANVTYAFINASYFWMYLLLKGSDLKDHPVKDEIIRVRKYMENCVLLKQKPPKLNVKVAKSLIRNALWDPTKNNTPKSQSNYGQRRHRNYDNSKRNRQY